MTLDPQNNDEVDRRVAERIAKAEEQKWIGTVNTAIEAVNLHLVTEQAHPRLLRLVEKSLESTERLEKIMLSTAPDDIKKYLPALIEREKRDEADRQRHSADIKKLLFRVTIGMPIATMCLGVLDVILRLKGK